MKIDLGLVVQLRAMLAPSKAQLIAELPSLGEVPPSSWTLQELKLRLKELRNEMGLLEKGKKNRSPLRTMTIDLNKAKKEKKENLRNHVAQTLRVPLTGNEAMDQLMNKGLQAIYDQPPATGTDPVGFEVHAAKAYEDIFTDEKGYMNWVLTTAKEDPHNCSPRLLRLANWLYQRGQNEMINVAPGVYSPQKAATAPTCVKTEGGKTFGDSMPSQSDANGHMIQVMQQLMTTVSQLNEEVQNLKEERPHKKEGKAVSEATSGSFELMHQ